jgi:hypothetical protein
MFHWEAPGRKKVPDPEKGVSGAQNGYKNRGLIPLARVVFGPLPTNEGMPEFFRHKKATADGRDVPLVGVLSTEGNHREISPGIKK